MSSNKMKFALQLKYTILIFLVLAGTVVYGSVRFALYSNEKRVFVFGPQESIIVQHPFDSDIYFNNTVGQTGSLDILKKQIDSAQHTLELAIFSFSSDELKQAIYAADKRGVKVTLVLNTSKAKQHDYVFSDLPTTIQRIDAGKYDAIDSLKKVYMHDKFMIVDRGYSTEQLTTGSFNFTTWGEKYNQSYFLVTHDHDLVTVYGKEFDLLKQKISGTKKLAVTTYNPWATTIQYTDSFIEVWFSPGFGKQAVKYRIIDIIGKSEKTLDLMMWDITDRQVASAVVKRVQAGVKVRIIAEVATASTEASMIPYLQEQKEKLGLNNLEIILDTKLPAQSIDVLPDDFAPYIHHHSLIADGKVLVFGSQNWSLWGFYNNDENAFVTDNSYLISEFQKTFDHFYTILK
ncbi:MAG: phospholipase D-like domain-containing protein [Candidatus Pacebacteria bacterium]|nr:phospholipase D-like domain-containing protein [Candidatus Paceibacterota bacterium]